MALNTELSISNSSEPVVIPVGYFSDGGASEVVVFTAPESYLTFASEFHSSVAKSRSPMLLTDLRSELKGLPVGVPELVSAGLVAAIPVDTPEKQVEALSGFRLYCMAEQIAEQPPGILVTSVASGETLWVDSIAQAVLAADGSREIGGILHEYASRLSQPYDQVCSLFLKQLAELIRLQVCMLGRKS